MKKIFLYFLVFLALSINLNAQITVSGSNGADGTYASLTATTIGAFNRINKKDQTGKNIVIVLNGNLTEPGSTSLNAGLWTSLIIYPSISGVIIDGNVNNPLIGLNGADNVTIDGRVNAIGSAIDLTLMNASTGVSASTIRFINSAENNNIKYCTIKGSGTGPSGGIILFSTANYGNGNDGNIIENNNITGNSTDRPINTIYSSGTAGRDNSGNFVRNNNFFDFLNKVFSSNGIYVGTNNSDWTISGNSFYETTPLVPGYSAGYYIIRINSISGASFDVSDNFIGGSTFSCGGSAWTKTNIFDNVFTGIYIYAKTGTSSNIQNNIIRNFDWSNSLNANWTGIQVAGGDVNVGTISGNTIGDINGAGSILVTCETTGNAVTAINITGSGDVDCQNNKIGSINFSNEVTSASSFVGINKNATSGTTIIRNNIIGSTTTTNSINAGSESTGNAQYVLGIYNTGIGAITISGNTIANMTNGSTNSNVGLNGRINGIYSTNGTSIISNNIIHDLTIGNAYNVSDQTASVCGISLSGTSLKSVTGNIIYNLSNTNASFSGAVIGLYFAGANGGNIISTNFIQGLTVSGSSNAASVYGIKINGGASSIFNNIIYIGGNTRTAIVGLYETGVAGNNNSLYFNTVYINGNLGSGTNKSYALYSTSSANTRDFRNNIFVNARSTTGGSNLHYAAWFNYSSNSNLTLDYNDYFAPGTGGVLGRYAGLNKTSLPIVVGNDANSMDIDPQFVSAGGIAATDYKIGVDLVGVPGTGITTDYGSNLRVNPTMGAWERPQNKWIGTTSTDYNTATNWTNNAVPIGKSPNIIFDDAPVNHCFLDADHTFNNITNGQPVYRLVTNGHKLTLKGNLIFINGAQVDASSTSSTMEFAGMAVQSIPTASFYNDKIYDLIVNNINNVTLNGNLSLLNNLTATSGLLDASTNSPTVAYSGLTAQSIENNLYLNERVTNLIIKNPLGVTLNTDFVVDNDMTINSDKLFTITANKQLTVLGALTNNAGNTGLVLKSDATGDSKLINNTLSVPATVELYLTGGLASPGVGIYHRFVPPVVSMPIGNTTADVRAALELTTFNGSLVRFVEPMSTTNMDRGWQYFDNYPGTPPGFTSLQSIEGYNIYFSGANDILKFKGQLNAPEHTFNLSYTQGNKGAGWNLVGNPYPCNYDLNGVEGLGTAVPGISNTVYYNNNGNYTYYNVLTKSGSTGMAYTDIIPPMTGFFVLRDASGTFTQLVLPVSSKTSTAGDTRSQHKRSLSDQDIQQNFSKVKLVLTSGTKSDETIVLLAEDARNTFNEHYDAFKLFNNSSTVPNIYSEVDGSDYFMKAVSGPTTSPVIIPLKVIISEPGQQTINISEFEKLEGIKVILKHGNVETSLGKNTSYNFTSGAGTFTDFSIVIGSDNTPASDKMTGEVNFKTWYNDNSLFFNISGNIEAETGSLIITDFNGRQVYNDSKLNIVPHQTTQISINLDKGFYVTDIMIHGTHYKSKFVVY